jgi:hypothetical protein
VCVGRGYLGWMEYPVVERAHVVPRCYLKQWARDERIGVRFVGTSTSKTIGLDSAAVRKRFYRRTRSDGSPIDDVEWSLSTNETAAAPLLSALREQWPLDLQAKSVLAGFFGLLLVRGPHWRNWHEDFTKQFVAEQQTAVQPALSDAPTVGVQSVLDGSSAEELKHHLLSDTQRLVRMLSLARKIAGVVGSMHWALVEFHSPLVATSDHPVVVWPGERVPDGLRRHESTLVSSTRSRFAYQSRPRSRSS